jgi:gentisate 1,2-dioxygenase
MRVNGVRFGRTNRPRRRVVSMTSRIADIEVFRALLEEGLAQSQLMPLWRLPGELTPDEPRPVTRAWQWRWSVLRELALRADDLISSVGGSERRALVCVNPGFGGAPFTTGALVGAVQCLGGGQAVAAHRHSPAAVRFVLEGTGACTVVDGERYPMEPGDVVFTPSWCWHSYENRGQQPALWFDGLDLPLVARLDSVAFQDHLSTVRSRPASSAPPEYIGSDDGRSSSARSTASLRFCWEQTDAALNELAESRRGSFVRYEFIDPVTGRSPLRTISCELHRIFPNPPTAPRRQLGGRVHVVFDGTGSTRIDDQTFGWGPGDIFVVPSWSVVEHEAQKRSDHFVISDRAVLEALGLYREETVIRERSEAG